METGIHFVAGAGLVDTIGAAPVQALNVRVIDPDGRPRAGVQVRFESLGTGSGYDRVPTVLIGAVASSSFGTSVIDTTNARGQASVRIRLGARAGDGGVLVSVPTFAFYDTATYTIRPGAAARLLLAPADSAIRVGRGYDLRASVVDRYGNPHAATITYTTGPGPLAVNGSTLTARAVGRGVVVAEALGLSATSQVSVVPEGTIAAYEVARPRGDALRVVTTRLDGSEYRSLAPANGNGFPGEMPTTWSRDGSYVVFHDGRYEARLFRVDENGVVTRVMPTLYPVVSEGWPEMSADGTWLHFSGRSGHRGGALWRMRSNGTSPQQIGPAVEGFAVDAYPSPSPDGSFVAYTTNRNPQYHSAIRILNVRTRTVDSLDLPGATPRWSPTGEWIAYVAGSHASVTVEQAPDGHGPIALVRPDGSGRKLLTTGSYAPGIGFSPDGKYLIARAEDGLLHVIDVATGEVLPLPFTGRLEAPSWKP